MSLDNILLGLLSRPASGYDLKTAFDHGSRYFWAAELSQIYLSLQRLEREGCLRSKSVTSSRGPDRRVYSITARGRRRLATWLMDPPPFGQERIGYIAQLYFMDVLKDLERTREFVCELRRKFLERIRIYQRIETETYESSLADDSSLSDEDFHRHLALRAGIMTMEARIRWCEEAVARIRVRNSPTRARRAGQKKGE